jgi:Ser/Thr protein kinase RdoA (MazF antagonist)
MDFSRRVLTLEDLRFDPPVLPLEEIRRHAKALYGLEGEFTPLAGERDQNFRIRTAAGEQYVFKVSGLNEPLEVVEMQVLALRHIETRDSDLPVPRVLPALDGGLIGWLPGAEGDHAVRLLSWLPGQRYQDGPFPSARGLQGMGRFIARLGRALRGFEHPATEHFMPWNMANGLVFSPQLKSLMPRELDHWLPDYFERLEKAVYPQLAKLRWQVIHQDAHGANLLRASDHDENVTGVIDFGDMIYGPLVCDLAACLSDFMEMSAEPVFAATEICRGYQSITPLHEAELELLLDLVMVRQIMVLQLFEFRRRNMEHPPAFVTDDQPSVMAMLQKLSGLDRTKFSDHLKKAVMDE